MNNEKVQHLLFRLKSVPALHCQSVAPIFTSTPLQQSYSIEKRCKIVHLQ